jgi:hypothetical protein
MKSPIVRFLTQINFGNFWTKKEIKEVSDSIYKIGDEVNDIYVNALKDPIKRLAK